jgi:hypothetical protein
MLLSFFRILASIKIIPFAPFRPSASSIEKQILPKKAFAFIRVSNKLTMMTVFQIIVLASLAAQGFALIGKCDFTQDCDYDDDCESGLICADKHKNALKALGYDERLANCGDTGVTQKYWEVCFDASILPTTPSSSSFGGAFQPELTLHSHF